MKLSEIKKTIKKLKRKEQFLLLQEQAIVEFKPLYDTLRVNTKQKVVNNNILVIKELFENFDNNVDLTELIEAINKQTKKIDNKKMLKSLKQMVVKLSKLEKKNYFDIDEFNKVFTNELKKVLNIIVDPNEIPNSTIYNRNKIGKITSVIEKYDDKTIKYNWTYDKQDQLTKVTSKVDDKTT